MRTTCNCPQAPLCKQQCFSLHVDWLLQLQQAYLESFGLGNQPVSSADLVDCQERQHLQVLHFTDSAYTNSAYMQLLPKGSD